MRLGVRRATLRLAWRSVLVAASVVITAGAAVGGYAAWVLAASRPALSGAVPVSGLSSPVRVERDAQGVPTIIAANRQDLARSLGFLHAQERFFQMDLLRRAGAGELSALVGRIALPEDRRRRLHRFRARAGPVLASQPAPERALITAYTEGVNAGLAALRHAPWEYSVLRVRPAPWSEADCLLVIYAMYFDLQASDPFAQRTEAVTRDVLGTEWANFLLPHGTPDDAPLDESVLPEPPLPTMPPVAVKLGQDRTPLVAALEHGSNNFAVAGRRTGTGAAMVANDMHLALSVPNIWYRARMQVSAGADAVLDLVGVTLPGLPFLVAGSNRHVAWAFTDSYIESGDAVVIDATPDNRRTYATPDGAKLINTVPETICAAHSTCETFEIAETIWGPIAGDDAAGRSIAWRWTAHDANAVVMAGFTRLESATSVRQALDAAHLAGLPQQNMLVGDTDGHIGWTVIGKIPRRVGLNDQLPHSWADGTHGWRGYLPAADIPEIVDPPSGYLWTANARVVGGEALSRLGDGGYASGLRASRIRDDLAARPRFSERDLLAIQTDEHAIVLEPWQHLMLQAIAAHSDTPKIAAMRPWVETWGGHAVPGSVGYRLVRSFRSEGIRLVFGSLVRPAAARLGAEPFIPSRSAWPVQRLLTERPTTLVPPPYHGWDDLTGAILTTLAAQVDKTPGGLPGFTWGAVNRVGIHHPIASAVPLLGRLTDPPNVPVAGDTIVPRVAVPGFGASERLVVSPGHETAGLFEMPAGQAGNPLAPYYGAGQGDWVAGAPAPLMPGPARWQLALTPLR